MSDGASDSSDAEIVHLEIDARPTWLLPIFFLVKTKIRIDGTLHRRRWGLQAFELSPGRHEVEISFPWFPFAEYAKSAVTIEARAGELVRLLYRMRIFTIRVQGASRVTVQHVNQLPAAIVRSS